MEKILVVDDERDILEILKYNLEKENYQVITETDGNSALRVAKEKKPNLIILDIMLPGINGIELCKILKNDEKTKDIPIIMLTVKSEEIDKVLALEIGADDYVTKPFSVRELLARIKAVLRRTAKKEKIKENEILNFKDIVIDPLKYEVFVNNKLINLTNKEFKLLYFLAQNKGFLLSREKLLEKVWGIDAEVETRTVDVHVRRLREKLGDSREHIVTVRSLGYKFI
ncbi:MAG: response regulator [Acidobacteriota bacterium]